MTKTPDQIYAENLAAAQAEAAGADPSSVITQNDNGTTSINMSEGAVTCSSNGCWGPGSNNSTEQEAIENQTWYDTNNQSPSNNNTGSNNSSSNNFSYSGGSGGGSGGRPSKSGVSKSTTTNSNNNNNTPSTTDETKPWYKEWRWIITMIAAVLAVVICSSGMLMIVALSASSPY